MHNEGSGTPERTKDYYRTRLTSAERSSGVVWRRAAFHVLAALSLVACVLSVYWWYVWCVTIQACVQTCIDKGKDFGLLSLPEDASWQDYFLAFDISSFSALILALFFTRFAYSGIKNTLWKRRQDGKAYEEHAYGFMLFPKYFESLCIQLGMLGTLLSFLLAAISQTSTEAATTPVDPGIGAEQMVVEVVLDEQATAASPEVGEGKLSDRIFPLLCASLVSTFVGTFVAYLVLPPMNWLNDWAVGVQQRGPTDEEATTERFLRQLDRTSQRLAEFETTTVALTGAAAGVQRFQTAAAEASENFHNMMKLLEQATQLFEASNQRSDKLSERLTASEEQSARVVHQIHRFAIELQKPLRTMFSAADKIQAAANEGHASLRELREVAEHARKPMAAISQTSATTWKILKEIRTSLDELATSERRQTNAIGGAAATFTEIGDTLSLFLKSLDAFLSQNEQGLTRELDSEEELALLRGEMNDISNQLSALGDAATDAGRMGRERDGRGARSRQSPLQSMSRKDEPWWRRWL